MSGAIQAAAVYTPPPRFALGRAEEKAIAECIAYYRERNLDPGYQGEFEKRYTEEFCRLQGGGYADAVATGTAALYVAIAGLGLPNGSEVLVSPITDPGTISSIILNGLIPKLVDSEPDSFNIGPEQVAARVTSKTKAIVVVHAVGQAADIIGMQEIGALDGLYVVEDCSQSHGAMLDGNLVGTMGHIAAFSAMYRKAHIAGGSGGLVYTKDRDLYHQALAHADRGKPRWKDSFDDKDPAQFLFPALNLHTDEISCAIGLASLRRLNETIQRRRGFVHYVCYELARRSIVCLVNCSSEDSPFILPVALDLSRLRCTKHEFTEHVASFGVGLSPHYRYLVADWPWVLDYLADLADTPNARAIRDRSFCLYLNENYTVADAKVCVDAILDAERKFAA